MGNSAKNMLIGVFIIAACTLLVGIVMFLKPSVGDGKKTLYVRFANISKINIGTRVTYAGKPVGEVVAINEIYQARSQPIDTIGRFYFYQLTLKVDSNVVVYNTDEISLQTSGLLGEKSVAIIPRRPPKGITPKIISNQPVYANSVDPIENAFNELSGVAGKMDETLDEVTKWLKENGDTVACAVKNFGDAMHQVDKVVAEIHEVKLIPEIHGAVHQLKMSFEKIHDALLILEAGGTFENIATTCKNLKQATGSIDIISQDLADGKGTLGKLIKNDDLYLRFTAVMSKVDTLMNDVNQYGILFHLNKGWQRTHAQRATLLTALDTPQSFKDYFVKEVDQVNSSMQRISMLIERAEQTPEKEKILQNELFKEDFAELLRKADELADNLRLYNQQLVESMK
ncbi:MAG: MCE family protein [Chlamydiales bacterium]|nr:MCE family protein [Chlamydiales bacterium]